MKIDWQPSAELKILKMRAQLLADVRLFFAKKNVLEVETPILSSSAPTAPYLDSFQTDFIPLGTQKKYTYYLQTSPEFTMKRLLAAGSGSIYQIAKVFRNGEKGRQHSPEFTMLEWYRPELNFDQLMTEVDDLLQLIAKTKPVVKLSYQHVFQQYLSLDVFTCTDDVLKQLTKTHIEGVNDNWLMSRDDCLELLMSHVIEPKLVKLDSPVFIYNFPASQSQLAKVVKDEKGNSIAKRFELYAGGMELANGYDELLDADELRLRFEQDNQQRKQQNKPPMPIDEKLLAAMKAGLPQCTGVALGLDRLMMLVTGEDKVNGVQSFAF
jgi:elongation factor P--(R)-beta-lysine ligase